MTPLDHATRHLFIVRVKFADPDREKDWNAWYNNEHVPAMLSVPGFISCNRYKDLAQERSYLTVYEIEHPDDCYSDACLEVSGWGEWRPSIEEWRRATYQLVDDFQP